MISEKKPLKKLGEQMFFTLPTILVFSITVLIPFIYGIYLTFMKMPTVISTPVFTGLSNYIAAIKDPKFWSSMGLTVKYVLSSIFLVNALGFTLAYLVTSGIRGQNFFRTSLFTPNLIGGLVLGYIWQFIFVQTLPAFGQKFGLEIFRLGWLGDEKLAFWAVVIVTVWQLSGYMMIIFIAGLVNVPRDVIEASTIDGANAWHRLTKITLPLMRPAFVITIFMTLKNTFMVYDINYSLTAGGPYNSTMMVTMNIVNKAFVENNYGIGQAEAIILFIIVAIVSGIQVYIGKKGEVEA
ncbi:carbohydrate ABC transporter permease [Clostridium thermarum]|uniref:carbohydrate ABC transporter permease n=1 Tax=Clostridium thermarum TaxID=1716543 RepID=UPI00111CF60D|nr:sugar ABC transporter permease [Clostridium thermarum]